MTKTTTLPQKDYLETKITQLYIQHYPGIQSHIKNIENILETNPLSKSSNGNFFIYRAFNLSEYLSNAISEIYKQAGWHVTEQINDKRHTFKFHKISD